MFAAGSSRREIPLHTAGSVGKGRQAAIGQFGHPRLSGVPPGVSYEFSSEATTGRRVILQLSASQPCHQARMSQPPNHWPRVVGRAGARRDRLPYSRAGAGRRHEDVVEVRHVATWTSQEGTARPLVFVSADPWGEQPRVLSRTPAGQVMEPFRGRTLSILDEEAGGACLEPAPDSRFCRGCGSLFVHRSHLRSLSHGERMTAASLRGANAVALVVDRMGWDPGFAAAILARAPRPPAAVGPIVLDHLRAADQGAAPALDLLGGPAGDLDAGLMDLDGDGAQLLRPEEQLLR